MGTDPMNGHGSGTAAAGLANVARARPL